MFQFPSQSYDTTQTQKTLTFCMSCNQSGDTLIAAGNHLQAYKYLTNYESLDLDQEVIHHDHIYHTQFYSQNQFVAMGNQFIELHDLRSNIQKPAQILNLQSSKKQNNHQRRMRKFSCRPNSTEFSLLTDSNQVYFYDVKKLNKYTHQIKNEQNLSLYDIKWQKNQMGQSHVFFMGGHNKNVGILKLYTFPEIQIIQSFQISMKKLCSISVIQSQLATVTNDSLLQIFQLPDILCKKTIDLPNQCAVQKCEYSYDGKYIAVGLEDKAINVYQPHRKVNRNRNSSLDTEKQQSLLRSFRYNSQFVFEWHSKNNVLFMTSLQSQFRENQISFQSF